MNRIIRWLKRRQCIIIRELIVLLCAFVLGMGYSYMKSDIYVPTINGNLYSMLAGEDGLFMILSESENNSLVYVDANGKLLNYAETQRNQSFHDFEVSGDTVYSILTNYENRKPHQLLVSLSLKDTDMRPKTLLDLTALPYAGGFDIMWETIYLAPAEEESPALRVVGVDESGQGYLLKWDIVTGDTDCTPILEGEKLYALKYVADGHYVWINQDKQVGQLIDGVLQRNVMQNESSTPYHISTYGTQCFISDSVTGNIFELHPSGKATLFHAGEEAIGISGFYYQQLEVFTTFQNTDGSIGIVGLCTGSEGHVIASETQTLTELHTGALWLSMIWKHGWFIVLNIWIVLVVLVEVARGILRSPRLVIRLTLCDLVITLLLVSSATFVQYRSFQQTITEHARQNLQLVGGNLAFILNTDVSMTSEEVSEIVGNLRQRANTAMIGGLTNSIKDVSIVEDKKDFSINVIWDTPDGPIIGYDESIPNGYLVSDVKSGGYLTAVTDHFKAGGSTLATVQNDMNTDYIYLQAFSQAGQSGCVTVTQPEEVVLAGQTSFLQRMLLVLLTFPLFFLARILITRRLLSPMKVIRDSLEEFYTCGGGNQMDLDEMAHTELYEVGRVFNQLSIQTRTQLNTLEAINDSYVRMVPNCLLQMFHKQDVVSLTAGEHVTVDGALLLLIPKKPARNAELLERLAQPAAEQIAAHGGLIVDYDESLGSLTALFPKAAQARSCAKTSLLEFDVNGIEVMIAVLQEETVFGMFGAEALMLPLVVSHHLHRKQGVLALLSKFSAVLVQSGQSDVTGLRLLGWDGDQSYYEDPAFRPAEWRTQWREASGLWGEAMELFRSRDFVGALRKFARVLRVMPGDTAARWYLFRCESLRGGKIHEPDTGLLFDWRGEDG